MSADSENYPDLRWNFRMGVANGVAFRLHDTLINPGLVLVVFLAHLTDNPILLGMVAPLWLGGLMLPQLWVGNRVQGRDRSLPLYKMVSLIRSLLWLALVLGTATLEAPTALIAVLFAFLLVYPLTWGVGALAFTDIVGKTIPPRLRGPFFSWRMTLGGLLALGGGEFVRRVLSPDFPPGFPHNFALIFAATAVTTITGLLFFHAVREPVTVARVGFIRPKGLREQGRAVRRILGENWLYRRFILARVALYLAANTTSLVVVYAGARFALPLENAPIFLIVDTATELITVALGGWLSLRLGNRPLALAAAALGLVAFAMTTLASPTNLSAHLALPYFIAVFALLAAYRGMSFIGTAALNLNIAPPDQRPLYIGLGNTVLGLAFYVSAAQGVLVPLVGYEGLFLLSALLMAFGLWQLTRIHDPTRLVPTRSILTTERTDDTEQKKLSTL